MPKASDHVQNFLLTFFFSPRCVLAAFSNRQVMRAPPIQLTLTACVVVFLTAIFILVQPSKPHLHWQPHEEAIHQQNEADFSGHVIMGKLGNETIK